MVERKLNVAIVGAQPSRVARVVSILGDHDRELVVESPNGSVETIIRVNYLPCVASFDFYEDERGNQVRYLAKVEYHGVDGRRAGASLAAFFDKDVDESIEGEDEDGDTSGLPLFPGISAVAIGCGIDSQHDVSMIQALVESLSGQTGDEHDATARSIIVKCVTPNPEYATMKAETEAYRSLSADEKEWATRSRTLGPGKMARFARSLAESAVELSLMERERTHVAARAETEHTRGNESIFDTNLDVSALPKPLVIDPAKTRYACRTCRTILFGKDQLEDPPHVPMLHSFSRKSSLGTSGKCESLFLADGLNWMGDISTAVEGKFQCPKCCTKLGHWKWAGAQCSCGTWVTPAIQVPFSKVDKVSPSNTAMP